MLKTISYFVGFLTMNTGFITACLIKKSFCLVEIQKIIKKVKCDQQTDRPTDKAGCRVACTRLKIVKWSTAGAHLF